MKKAIADAYSPSFGRKLDPETEVTITTGANEGSRTDRMCLWSRLEAYEGYRNAERFYGLY